jgi:transcriptional regulator of acetoin/glycerol metabolism
MRAESLVDGEVLDSWDRCSAAGLAPDAADPQSIVSSVVLREASERNGRLIALAQPIIDTVSVQIRGSASTLLLADANGLILRTTGDADFLGRADRVALKPGADWSEAQRGTNAIGTVLASSRALEIVGGEHFLSRNALLTCSAAPLFDPAGHIVGVLDISGDYRAYQPHTLGLARMAAQWIEQRLFESDFASHLLLAIHPEPEYVGVLGEGVLAIRQDGAVLGANPSARSLLGLRRGALDGLTFGALFEQPLGRMVDSARRQPASLFQLTTRNGLVLCARLRGELPPVAATVSRARPTPTLQRGPAPSLEEMSADDAVMAALVSRARRMLGHDIPILIQGESGAGKEMLARALHAAGPRSGQAFVALNCAAIPETLIESELFGYEAGAFTGARREGAPGRIQQADGGTLFLDEIGDMPLALQARLLRVLQERCVTPLGGERTIAVDLRLVCATHRQLRDEVARGAFREDLYYRINGLTLKLPALRERSDLAALVERLLREEAGGRKCRLAPEVLRAFTNYAWPGNLRQLHNVLRVAVALLDDGQDEIGFEQLPDDLREELFMQPARPGPTVVVQAAAVPASGAMLVDVERDAIRRALDEAGGNISAAARKLGISRTTLYRKLH